MEEAGSDEEEVEAEMGVVVVVVMRGRARGVRSGLPAGLPIPTGGLAESYWRQSLKILSAMKEHIGGG